MKTKILTAFFLTLALCAVNFAQTFDKAKLDQFFDALAAKDKAMGSVAVLKDGKMTLKQGGREYVLTKEK